jgi:GNAT superfamily N-acetyltransferase
MAWPPAGGHDWAMGSRMAMIDPKANRVGMGGDDPIVIPAEAVFGAGAEPAQPTVKVYRGIFEETENGSAEGYVTDPANEPNFGNWLDKEGCRNRPAVMDALVGPVIAILKNMHVDDDARGNGEGNKLMGNFLETASSLGATTIVLLADTQDDQNGSGLDLVAFYEGWGFRVVDQTSGGPIMVLNS